MLAVPKTRQQNARELIHGQKDRSRTGCPRSVFDVRCGSSGSAGSKGAFPIASNHRSTRHHAKPGVRASCGASARSAAAAAPHHHGAGGSHRHPLDARRRGYSERRVRSWCGPRAAIAAARTPPPTGSSSRSTLQSRRIHLSISTGATDVQLNMSSGICLTLVALCRAAGTRGRYHLWGL